MFIGNVVNGKNIVTMSQVYSGIIGMLLISNVIMCVYVTSGYLMVTLHEGCHDLYNAAMFHHPLCCCQVKKS